jgi:hypothetical protein
LAGKKLREKSGATVLTRQASLNFPSDKNKVASAGIERTKRNMIIDYSHFRFRAVVDWVEIEILTERHTNFQTVQKQLRVILEYFPLAGIPKVTVIDIAFDAHRLARHVREVYPDIPLASRTLKDEETRPGR